MDAPVIESLLDQAAQEASGLWLQALGPAREALMNPDMPAADWGDSPSQTLLTARKLLDSHGPRVAQHLPQVLRSAFRRADASAKGRAAAPYGLRLDTLELMDDSQLRERIELARAQEVIAAQVQAAQTDLLPLLCALMGLDRVVAERNPLPVQVYVESIQQCMVDFALPVAVRALWWRALAQPLGLGLAASFQRWIVELRCRGVRPVGFTVPRSSESTGRDEPRSRQTLVNREDRRAQRPVWTPQYRKTFLNLQKLRDLMVGDLRDANHPREAFERRFAMQFEANRPQDTVDSGFAATVPAALDALEDVRQLDAVVQRMRAGAPSENGTARERLRASATTTQQLLALEVLALMLDNLSADERLPGPVREMIASLEPALSQLVVVDSRFFSNRQHPARRLLDEIASQGLAFSSEQDEGFAEFMNDLRHGLACLLHASSCSAESFAQALATLTLTRQDRSFGSQLSQQLDGAVQALSQAERRNELAEDLKQRLRELPEIQRIPIEVAEFLLGPWCQVMAMAQLLGGETADDDPGGYKCLVNDLLWSVQPALASQDISRLTQMVPRLLSKLREGLKNIDYPSHKVAGFFETLMKCHQMAFNPTVQEARSAAPALASSLLSDAGDWVAPSEAQASGFMSLEDAQGLMPASPQAVQTEDCAAGALPAVGTWYEIQTEGTTWRRTQLTWVSPRGTLLLFTSGLGRPQSMSKQAFERWIAQGKMRALAKNQLVEDALQGVVEAALQNTLATQLQS
ncbi:MAG: hypothetical protein OHK0048_07360 [Rhodoferax sp.]